MKVRVYGHVGQSTGFGRACRDLCMSLLAAGVELEIRPLGAPSADEITDSFGAYPALHGHVKPDELLSPPDVVIVHTLPMDCRRVMDLAIDDEHTRGFDVVDVPWIAYTTWEALTTVPLAMRASLDGGTRPFAQIWVPSTVTARAFYNGDIPESMDGVPVRVMPHAFDTSSLELRAGDRLEADGPWSYYYYGAWSTRKNPSALLRAWALAFEPTDHVKLHLHCPGASQEAFAVALHQTGLVRDKLAPVVFRPNRRIDDNGVHIVHREMDVFVSSTRGESWNLPAFDAMLARRHIIHTAGTGADHFLRATSAALVPGFAVPAAADVRVTRSDDKGADLAILNPQGLSSRSTWIEPDLVRVATAMRDAYVNRTRDLSVLYSPAERFGYEAVGKLARTALEAACDRYAR